MAALDQSLFNPTINACFLTMNSILDGFSSEEIARRLRTLLPGIVANSVKVLLFLLFETQALVDPGPGLALLSLL